MSYGRAAKATGDAAEFKKWRQQISQSTAEAASEGGGLFSAGVRVRDAEKATLGEISTALGVWEVEAAIPKQKPRRFGRGPVGMSEPCGSP